MQSLPHHAPLLGDDGEILPGWRTLAGARSWVCWRFGPRRSNGKPAKLPVSPVTGSGKNWSAPENLSDYVGALRCARVNDWCGVGLVIRRELGIVGLDLDGARFKSDNGKWQRRRWASDILGGQMETYSEVSPSGQGYRMIALGELDQDLIANASGVEIYGGESGRFLTITGRRLPGSPDGPRSAPETIRRALDRAKTHGAKAAEPSALNAEVRASGGLLPALATGELSPMRLINEIALGRLDTWVPEALPLAERSAGGVWRISSEALGRNLEEDVSLSPKGIRDFGEERPLTAIDVVMQHLPAAGPSEAARWLLDRLGLTPGFRSILTERGSAFAAAEPDDVFSDSSLRRDAVWPAEALPSWLDVWASDMARRSGVDADVARATVFAGLMMHISGFVRFDPMGDGDFATGAAIFFAMVGNSGTGKTTLDKKVFAPLRALEGQWRRAHDAARKRHERAKKVAESVGLSFEDDAPPMRRRIAQDTTVEAMTTILAKNPAGLTVVAGELGGWIGSIDRYQRGSRGGSADSAFWLEVFDGCARVYDRKTEGASAFVERPHVSVFGGIQPDLIARLMDGLAIDGLVQRFLFVELRQALKIERTPIEPEAAKRYRLLCELLLDFQSRGPDFVITATPGALGLFDEVENWALGVINDPGVNEIVRSVASKGRGYVMRLALGLHMLEWAGQVVIDDDGGSALAVDEADDPMLSIGMAQSVRLPPSRLTERTARAAWDVYRGFFYPTALNVFGRAASHTQLTVDVREAATVILKRAEGKRESITRRDFTEVRDRFRGPEGGRRLSAVLEALEAANWIGRDLKGGAKSTRYSINSAVFDGRFGGSSA